MWLKKLKKKKLQFILLGFILAFATMILSTCLSFSQEVTRYTNSQYDDSTNADLILYATKGTSALIKNKAAERTDISSIETYDCYNITNLNISHKNNLIQDYINPLYAIVISDYNEMPFKITPVEGSSDSSCPLPGQVWVQNIVADNHTISINDTFDITSGNHSQSLTVSTLVNDTRKPVSMTTGASIFINQADTGWFESQEALEVICIKTDATSQEILDWLDTVYTDQYHSESYDALSMMKQKATLMTTLISALGTLSSGFMLIITIIVIVFFIKNTIINEYNAIGIYKSIGFSTMEIMGFYQKAYAFVGMFSITIGAFLGLPMSIFVGRIVMEYVGDYSLSIQSVYSTILVITGTGFLLIFSIWLALIKIRKITPVDAFRTGAVSSKAKLKKSLIRNAHSSFSMSINDIFKYKSRSAIIVLIVSVSFYISIMLINMCIAFGRMETNAPGWISSPKCECFISSENGTVKEDLLNYVQNSSYVDSYITGALFSKLDITCNDKNINIKYANISNFNTYDYALTGIEYGRGRPPKNENEVAIDSATLKNSNYNIGDYITLTVHGMDKKFMISGIYNTMMTPSLEFTSSAFSDLPKELYDTSVGVNLKTPKDMAAFKAEVNELLPDYTVGSMLDIVDDIKISIMSVMIPVTIIIIVIFFAFTLLNIINMIVMNNNEQKRNFGILKAYGFTNGYIIRRNVYKIAILSTLGALISAILDQLISARIFSSVLGVDAYTTQRLETALFLVAGLGIIIAICVFISLSIKKISPKNLMEE